MFFRFGSAIVMAVLVSMGGVAIEKRILDLRRDIVLQRYQTDVLLEAHAGFRLITQRRAAPSRLIESMDADAHELRRPDSTAPRPSGWPLLRWQRAEPLSELPGERSLGGHVSR